MGHVECRWKCGPLAGAFAVSFHCMWVETPKAMNSWWKTLESNTWYIVKRIQSLPICFVYRIVDIYIYTFTLSQMQVNIRYMEQFGIFSDCPPPNKHLETSPTNSFHGSPPKWLHEGGLHPWSLTVRPWKMVIGRWSYLGPLSLFIGKLALKLQGKKCLQRIGDRNSSSRLLEVP